ncbi:stage VI sporulation protein F [Alkalihalobacillus sp. AL-G]|uniref:stage VI sporulation protein F n=1 Tax=Alkalihalobacillus sp. AL-G TaxID=2926399 RepID=UPI00272BACF9|nr:stage VI sporulation protein F [Alkalihalobacillus sp. AL-G]WLD91837.1 stage VI sporulation protein F [Alkalihalobacillus sp. AL-G]
MDRNNFMDDVEKKTGVKKNDIFKLADSVQNANLRDEKTIRQLIAQVSRLAGVPVSKEKEEQIVNAILKNNIPLDMTSIAKMFKQK